MLLLSCLSNGLTPNLISATHTLVDRQLLLKLRTALGHAAAPILAPLPSSYSCLASVRSYPQLDQGLTSQGYHPDVSSICSHARVQAGRSNLYVIAWCSVEGVGESSNMVVKELLPRDYRDVRFCC